MGNLITEKIIADKLADKNIRLPVCVVETGKTAPSNITEEKSVTYNYEKLLIPATLIGAGGVLLYFGLVSPNKMKFFQRDVQKRLIKMTEIYDDTLDSINKIVSGSFAETKKYVKNFMDKHNIDISQDLIK